MMSGERGTSPAPWETSAAPGPAPRRRRRDWRTYVGGLGRILISLGVLILLFVVYQLWGTNIQEARAQDALSDDFEELLASVPSTTPPTTAAGTGAPATTAAPATTPAGTVAPSPTLPLPTAVSQTTVPPPTVPGQTTTPPPPTAPPTTAPPTTPAPVGTTLPPALRAASSPGNPVARIEIPEIGVDKIVVAGVAASDLKKGPGHYPSTPMPGERGNAAIAGHRTTYGAPFSRVDELDLGDEIVVTTVAGRFVYRVTGTQIVAPTDASVLSPTEEPRLTLTSCHPRYSTAQRIIVTADLDPNGSSQLREPPPPGLTPVLVGEPGDSGQTVTSVATEPTSPGDAGTPPADPAATAPAATTGEPGDGPGYGPGDDDASGGVATTAGSSEEGTNDDGGDETAAAEDVAAAGDAFARGWFSDPDAWPHLALWGLALTAIALGAWLLGKKVLHRQWVGLLLAIVPFTVALYFFYENVARLLPPNV